MLKRIFQFSLIIIVFVILGQCKHEVIEPPKGSTPNNPVDTNNPPPIDDTSHPCDKDTVYFVNNIEKLINTNCAKTITGKSCHSPTDHEKGFVLNNYDNIMNSKDDGQSIVIPYEPSKSKLYKVIVDGEMPPYPEKPLTAQEKSDLYTWILQGALNNYCYACDSIYTFTDFVFPLIQINCQGCHSGANPSKGITFNNFDQIKAQGNLILATIRHDVGYTAMPYNTSKLAQCQIDNMEKWIQDGMPNN